MDNWSDASCQIHHVLKKPMIIRSGWLKIALSAAFGERRLSVYSFIPECNEKSMKFHQHAGFKETGRVVDGFAPGEDYVLVTMRREACKYLEK